MYKLAFVALTLLKCNELPNKTVQIVGAQQAEARSQSKAGASQNQINWKDKRPICAVFLSSHKATPLPGNPRNWKIDGIETFDIFKNPEEYRNAVLKHADNSVLALKDMNAQGIVLWDIEGQQFGHPISYIGDPTNVKKLAPEMDAIADKFFKKFTDAGLRVGVCLRPDTIRWDGNQKFYWHFSVANPTQNLIDKIRYAKKRWGCTMFYVDSNVYPDPVYGQLMHDSVFKKLYATFSDCLIMPEHENQEYYKYTLPYQQVNNFRHLLTVEKHENPNANMVLYVPDGFPGLNDNAKISGMRASLEQGNILMFRNWYADPINALIKKAYQKDKK